LYERFGSAKTAVQQDPRKYLPSRPLALSPSLLVFRRPPAMDQRGKQRDSGYRLPVSRQFPSDIRHQPMLLLRPTPSFLTRRPPTAVRSQQPSHLLTPPQHLSLGKTKTPQPPWPVALGSSLSKEGEAAQSPGLCSRLLRLGSNYLAYRNQEDPKPQSAQSAARSECTTRLGDQPLHQACIRACTPALFSQPARIGTSKPFPVGVCVSPRFGADMTARPTCY
jgi:hypothetical protein